MGKNCYGKGLNSVGFCKRFIKHYDKIIVKFLPLRSCLLQFKVLTYSTFLTWMITCRHISPVINWIILFGFDSSLMPAPSSEQSSQSVSKFPLPVVVSHSSFARMVTPVAVNLPWKKTGVYSSPLERFFGSIFHEKHLHRVILKDTTVGKIVSGQCLLVNLDKLFYR